MKVLVACDEYCYQLANDFYLKDFGVVLANRYLSVFKELRFVLRTKIVNDKSELGKYNIKVTDPRIEIFPIPFYQGPREYLKRYFTIQRLLKDVTQGCDIAVFRLPSATAFAVWEKALKNKLPYGVELVYDCWDGYMQASGINKLLWWRMHKKQIKACSKALGMAPVTSSYLQKHYLPHHPIIQSHYSSVEMTDDFFYKPRKYPDKKVLTLVHVANQIEYNGRKGHKDIIQALKILKDKGVNVNVIFIGEDYFGGIGKLKSFANELGVDSQIRFTGFLKYSDMREQLRVNDIAILPTKAEGLPRVLIEAMAMGLPALASNVSGNPELLDPRFLFNYGDINSIVSQIELLVNDKNLYEEMSLRNFEHSQEFRKDVLDKRRKEFYTAIKNKIN